MNKKEVLKQLPIEKKLRLMTGNSNWTMFGIKDFDIDEIRVSDGPHGVRAYHSNHGMQSLDDASLAPSTLFPSATAMAATWNEELLFKIGEAIGKECNHYGVDVLLAPGVNLKRSPLAGRNFEYYSEDPYLTTRCGANFIKGVQSQKIPACVKHFALNEQENQRRFINTIVDERTMHELYLRPFQDIIEEANPHTIMASYNKVNGYYASESPYLLKEVLREKWGYKGVVISDWGACQNRVLGIKNGLNVEMPGQSEFYEETLEAYHNNEFTDQELDESLYPLFDLYETVKQNDLMGTKADFNKHHELAIQVAEEAIVLLENDGILPLKPNTKIGVIGHFAKTPRINGGGSSTLLPYTLENPLEELKKEFTVDYTDGYNEDVTTTDLLNNVKTLCENNDTILYFTGTTESLEVEGKDRPHMNLPQGHIDVFNEIKKHKKQVVVILNNGSVVDVTPLENNTNAIIEAFFLGGANGKALVNILTGKTNPSGRLSETYPLNIKNTPHYRKFPLKEKSVNVSGDLINLGYRFYDSHDYPVRYPFGYGLSYTEFTYKNLTVSNDDIDDTDTIAVSITVENTGKTSGKETVQLYVEQTNPYYYRPLKELKAFKKVSLKPGEETTIAFTLDKNAFNIYNIESHSFEVETGNYIIHIGKNVRDIELSKEIKITSTQFTHYISLEEPFTNFKLYKEEAYNYIVENYRHFPWYEIEEPAIRLLKRLRREYNFSEERFKELCEILEK